MAVEVNPAVSEPGTTACGMGKARDVTLSQKIKIRKTRDDFFAACASYRRPSFSGPEMCSSHRRMVAALQCRNWLVGWQAEEKGFFSGRDSASVV